MKKQHHTIKNTLHFFDQLIQEKAAGTALEQQYRYIRDLPSYGKAIAEAEQLSHHEYQLAMTAVLIFCVSAAGKDSCLTASCLLQEISGLNQFSREQEEQVQDYLNALSRGTNPHNDVEKVLLDTANVHLGLADGLEWLALQRQQAEQQNRSAMEEGRWAQHCYDYFLSHGFYSQFANEKWGHERNRNFTEIGKRLEKINMEAARGHKNDASDAALSDKEGENLFKVAFRNYLNLVAMTDRKAHLLIQVNAVLASVIIGFTIKRADNTSYFIVPTTLILLVAVLTIFYAIMASRPLKKYQEGAASDAPFFFGSFDRIDPNFKRVSWEHYFLDIQQLFRGSKELVFNELIKESFQVRKVLAQKFGFLSIAYRIFIAGQIVSIGVFLIMLACRS